MLNNYTVDNFQSAYKACHSCETALLRVYNDIVTTIGTMLVLLDFSAAFDAIDHDNLFCILEKYVRISGNTPKRIISYFSNYIQCVQPDNVLSDFIIFLWYYSGLLITVYLKIRFIQHKVAYLQ